MIRKIFKWIGMAILFLVTGLAVATVSRQHLTYDAPYPNIKASTDPALIEKGKNNYPGNEGMRSVPQPIGKREFGTGKREEPSLAGARRVETPFGTFYTPNITSDATIGIGSITDAEIARVLRYGIKSNGEAVLPFMQGQDMNNEDMTTVISYLRSLKPIENKVPENEYNLIGFFAKAFVLKPDIPENTLKYNK